MSDGYESFDSFLARVKKEKLLATEEPLDNRPRGRAAKEEFSKMPKAKRETVKRIFAAKAPGKAMYKIIKASKGGANNRTATRRGLNSAMKLATYVTRNGELSIENSNGENFNNLDDIKDYFKNEWEPDFTTRKNGNDLLHVVVSTPAHSDRNATLAAARDFGGDYMKNHDYLMVRHDDTSYPHVHFIVKNRGYDGRAFPVKKADLEEARDSFAHYAREHGIELSSSRRAWDAKEKSWHRREDGEREGTQITASEHFKDSNPKAITNTKNGWVQSAKEFIQLGKEATNDKGRDLMLGHADLLKDRIKEFMRDKRDIERGAD